MALNRDGFAAGCARRYLSVQIEGLGDVRLQSLSQAEYLKHLDRMAAAPESKAGEKDSFRRLFPSILTSGVVDDSGAPVFSGIDDPLLAELEPVHVMEIGNALLDHWRLVAPKEALKNSAAVPAATGPTS